MTGVKVRIGWFWGCLVAGIAVPGAADGLPPLDAPERPFEEHVESIAAAAAREQAHARMPSTMYASTPSEQKPYFAHSTPPAAASDAALLLDHRKPATTATWNSATNNSDETAETVFRQRISGPVVQTKCVRCHVSDGVSGHTRLVFVPSSRSDHLSLNYGAFEDLLAVATDGDALVLDKIKGARGHGGGIQVAAGSAQYADMRRFLDLLGGSDNAAVTAQTLFDTVRGRGGRRTLYQAAIILAGRIPTDAEYASLGGWTQLRAATRGLMTGPGFHDFLIRAANDRLLTDAGHLGFSNRFVNSVNEGYRLRRRAEEGNGSERTYGHFVGGASYGLQRAPLELIAHVVVNDLPYTEVLTADYVMANPAAAVVYGSKPTFEETDDIHDFRPARIVDYYPDSGKFVRERDEFGRRITDPGLVADYPHAGLLNTVSLLYRHPTSPTNRNRARARWAYYHFLGVDVERLGRRAIDIDALADEKNPTMNNPACTGCHAILDPVAGTFQNYDEDGEYRSNRGLDSLPESYKESTWRLLSTEKLPLERTTVSMEADLVDKRYDAGLLFEQPSTDHAGGHVYLETVVVRNAAGRQVAEEPLWSMSYSYDDTTTCKKERPDASDRGGHFALDKSCSAWLHFGGDCFKNLRKGKHRFEVVAWSSEGATLRTRLSVPSAYEEGDVWFRDMRAAGFNGRRAPRTSNSSEWLGRRIAEDERFAEATVKFWWPAIMGSEVVVPPTDADSADYEGARLAAESQNEDVERLARMFRAGIRGGTPYNLKDLLTELVVSKWFMAEHVTDADPVRHAALQTAGAARPLTPEELVAKTEALTGFTWGRYRRVTGPERDRPLGTIERNYRVLYGGIDSRDTTHRNRAFTMPMALVAKKQAMEISIAVVARDFFLVPQDERRLFAGIELDETPETAPDAIKDKLVELHGNFFGLQTDRKSTDVLDAYRFLVDAWRQQSDPRQGRPAIRGWYDGGQHDHRYMEGILDAALHDEDEGNSWFRWNHGPLSDHLHSITATEEEMWMMEAWGMTLTAMLMDYRYLHL